MPVIIPEYLRAADITVAEALQAVELRPVPAVLQAVVSHPARAVLRAAAAAVHITGEPAVLPAEDIIAAAAHRRPAAEVHLLRHLRAGEVRPLQVHLLRTVPAHRRPAAAVVRPLTPGAAEAVHTAAAEVVAAAVPLEADAAEAADTAAVVVVTDNFS